MQCKPSQPDVKRRQFLLLAGAGAASLVLLPGCSLGVMFNRMLVGDPMIPAEFKSMTKVDLTKGDRKIMVVCSTPASVDDELSTLKLDLIDGVTRRMKVRGIDVVDPDKIASWIDDHGAVSDPSELAQDFDTNYIAWIDIKRFTFREESSPKLLRGKCTGFIRVYRVTPGPKGAPKYTDTVYETEFDETYPKLQPVSETGKSAVLFQKEYVNRTCETLAEKFYDHRPGHDM